MKKVALKSVALFSFFFILIACEEAVEPDINQIEEEEVLNFPVENFISSFEQIVSGPYKWYWEFEHQYSGDIVTTTKVNQALFGEFGQKAALQYSHTFDSNGNVEYSTIERGPVLNDDRYYVYELDEEGFIKSVALKDDPEGTTIRRWSYTYDDNKRIISKDVEHTFSVSQNSTEFFSYDENGEIVNVKIEMKIDNSVVEERFDFNDQRQLIEIRGSNGYEVLYNELGYISSVKFIQGDTSFVSDLNYSSGSLIVQRNFGPSRFYFAENMKFQKARVQVEEEDFAFIVEGLPKEEEQQIIEEHYFDLKGDENMAKGSREYNLYIDSKGDLSIDLDSDLRFYDLDGDLAYVYSQEGSGWVWYRSNGEKVEVLTSLPDWVRNWGSKYITYRPPIHFFNARSYNQ